MIVSLEWKYGLMRSWALSDTQSSTVSEPGERFGEFVHYQKFRHSSFPASHSVWGQTNDCIIFLKTNVLETKKFLLQLFLFGLKIEKFPKMLMNNGPWSPEHIYQEIAGYTTSRHRGEINSSSIPRPTRLLGHYLVRSSPTRSTGPFQRLLLDQQPMYGGHLY